MFTTPSTDDLLEGIIIALQRDVLPEVQSQRAQITILMMQGLLQTARQVIPVQQQNMVEEHNQMTALFRDMAQIIGDSAGPEADRIRSRGKELGGIDDIAPIPAFQEICEGHRMLTQALVDTMRDLDVLIREGNTAAEEALGKFRAMMGPRTTRDFQTYMVGAGMAGRG